MGEQYIVTVGNLADGITFTGPFADMDEAHDWALENADEWQIVPLISVSEPVSVWHLNVYEQDRAYGGPEEGGWWYTVGVYQPMMSTTFDADAYDREWVVKTARDVQVRLDEEADSKQVPPVGHSNYNGGRYLTRVEAKPGADFPADRPVYS